MKNSSARNMWGDYLDKHLEDAFHEAPKTLHFSDNEKDANTCAELVKSGIKIAAANSLIGIQNRNEKLPKIGNFTVVTNWEGKAQCIVETTKVTLKPYFSIDEMYTKKEGEEDTSLAYWKKVHWEYFTRELEAFNRIPNESMIVVCEEFKMVFKR